MLFEEGTQGRLLFAGVAGSDYPRGYGTASFVRMFAERTDGFLLAVEGRERAESIAREAYAVRVAGRTLKLSRAPSSVQSTFSNENVGVSGLGPCERTPPDRRVGSGGWFGDSAV
jgi:hypothetical protein